MVSNYPSDTAYAWWLMEHFWKTQADLFNQAGKKAYLAYPEITFLSETISNSPIETVELTFPWHSREEAIQARKFLSDKNITFIYFTDQPYFNPQYAVMRLQGVQRIVIHDHTPGDRPPILGFRGAWKAIRNRLHWFTADKVLCVSELMRQRNMANGRIPAHKCTVVQNGIQLVTCNKGENIKIRESLGVVASTLLVITTGRAHSYKRFDFIIQCANTLRKQAPELDAIFLLVGDGSALIELQDMVARYNLEGTVRLLGFRTDVRDLLCASNLALHAALGEGFSLSIIEYMSAGLPVLVPDIPSVSQATKHNKNGYIYPKNDTEIVAKYIHELAVNKELQLSMGTEAKMEANRKYSLEQCTKKFINIIEQIYN